MSTSRLRDEFNDYKQYIRNNALGLPRLIPLPAAVQQLNEFLEAVVDAIDADIRPALQNIESQVETLRSRVTGHDDRLDELEATIQEQQSQIDNLQTQLGANKDDE